MQLPIGGGGGPALEALARDGNRTVVPLPVPMQSKKNLDFSFAGLKTAVRVAVQKAPPEERSRPCFAADVAAAFQHAAFSHLEQRLKYAFAYCEQLHADTHKQVCMATIAAKAHRAKRERMARARDPINIAAA